MTPATEPAPDFVALEATLEEKRLLVEEALRRLVAPGEAPAVDRAIEDSLFAPAKRLRPILSLLVAEILHGDPGAVLPAACAVEMVHTASLILDDLPSMDDAKTRRGRPACHVRHGEATAILAAFALLSDAYEILAGGWAGAPEAAARSAIAKDLARAVGRGGMIAGQAMDLAMTDRPIDFPTLEFIHSRKTGVLFMTAAAVGAAAARAGAWETQAVKAYAKNLGLAFQIVDDLIDVEGGVDVGKDLGQDAKKTTFVSFSGTEGARQLARELVVVSQQALTGFGARAAPLRDLAGYVVARRR
ncbi:MAG TPA: polyprenyl synthetase family protein [Vicinamibacteria bacterium]|nr:polyprenyl synthetase family protein [Vicinamibacteria bacterium]